MIANLLSNAIKYSPAGGVVTVTATGARVHCASRSATAALVSRPPAGAGLRPLLPRRLLGHARDRRHRARARALPRDRDRARRPHRLREQEAWAARSGSSCRAWRPAARPRAVVTVGSILVAEDDETVRRLDRRGAGAGGRTVLRSRDWLETLGDDRRRPPGLLILDLSMPGIDGFGVLERLLERPETRYLPVDRPDRPRSLRERAALSRSSARVPPAQAPLLGRRAAPSPSATRSASDDSPPA